MPKNPGGYYDPKTGILHQSNGATVTGDNSTGVSGEAIIQEAEKYVGKLPYVWGGSSLETGADCSGFVWAILKKLGLIDWERTNDVGIRSKGTEVASLEEAQAGDVICYAGHVAFYDGHGGIVHEADETQGCKHGNNAAFTDIITIRRFANGNSSGTATTDNSSSDSSTNSGTFKVKVVTWQENSEKIVSTDSSENMNQNNYSMSEITIPYQAIVAQYRMPFNYLWTMLVYSNNDKDYVFDLANLVRNSQIEITIHDNLQDTTTTTVESHTEKYHYEGEADVKFNYTNTILAETPQTQPPLAQAQPSVTTSQESTTQHGTATEDTSSKYRKTTTTRNKTNTLDIALTLADTWCVKFEKEYEYDGSLKDNSSSSSTYEDQVDEEQYNQISRSSLLNKVINNAQNNAIKTFVEQRKTASINSKEVIKSSQKTTQTITDRKTSTETNTTTKKYTAKPEKYDLDDTPKFAIVFNRHYNARSNILSAKDWFFEALESNADTVNMVDLTKYLMYKATGTNYGATDFYAVFNKLKQNYTNISGGVAGETGGTGGTSGIDGNPGKVYDFLLSKGVPAVGAAAIMGNIENESNFSPTVVNSIGASGLCQWYQGRATALKEFAKTKNTDWTDLNTQLEFMWRELEISYSKVKGVIMSASAEEDLEYATWYWGSYFETYDSANQVGYETSRQWKEEKERYASAQKWYYDWKQKHTSSGTSGTSAGSDTSTDISQAILSKANANSTPWPGKNMCLQWVDDVYSRAGINPDRKSTAFRAWKAHGISTDKNNIPIGAAVYGTGVNSEGAGHVGIYIGNGKVVDSVSSGINTSTLDQWISWQTDTIEGHRGWLGWGWEDGNRTRGLK